MKTLTRFGMAGVAVAALAWCAMNSSGFAGGTTKKSMAADVDAAAAAIGKGDKKTAAKHVKKVAKKYAEEIYHVMYLFKLRGKKGFGIGKVPDKVFPDGIDKQIRVLRRAVPAKAKIVKNKDAYVQMALRSAAIAKISIAAAPGQEFTRKKPKAKWIQFSKEMYDASLGFAKAAKSGSPAAVQKAATKLDNSCSACHSVFRDN